MSLRNGQGLRDPLYGMQPGAVIFPHLFDGQSFVAPVRGLDKLFLNLLQPFLSLDMSDLRLCSVLAPKAMPIISMLECPQSPTEEAQSFPEGLRM